MLNLCQSHYQCILFCNKCNYFRIVLLVGFIPSNKSSGFGFKTRSSTRRPCKTSRVDCRTSNYNSSNNWIDNNESRRQWPYPNNISWNWNAGNANGNKKIFYMLWPASIENCRNSSLRRLLVPSTFVHRSGLSYGDRRSTAFIVYLSRNFLVNNQKSYSKRPFLAKSCQSFRISFISWDLPNLSLSLPLFSNLII